ncbi:TRAP transporter substrate-binding protein [Arvimicrobium flavum]|uniref:TRAP transporter substrate-binding protein n=1 Tax=Arvimicrobium flavum TaxID=3393320 RepID=UPI00237C05B1|nr:TRAP transporter substrate-binding protein [Mesorhizobium shangrilense]
MNISRRAALAAAFVLGLAGTASAQVTLKYGHPNPNESIGGQFANRFAELVKEKTSGSVVVNVFPSSQLGTAKERFEGVQFGLIDFGHDSYSTVGQAVPDFGALDLPYLYRDVEHAVAATTPETSPVARELNERLKSEAQMEVLGTFLYGIRELTTSNYPVRSPDDLAGKRIRAIPVPVWIGMVEGMNAIPTPVDFAELTTALATGVIDGQENPLTAILTSNMYDSQKYLILTDHMINIIPLFVNSASLARLSPEQQTAIRDAARQAGQDILAISVAEHERLKTDLAEKGMTVISTEDGLDLEAFRTRVSEHVRAKFPEWASIIEGIQALR